MPSDWPPQKTFPLGQPGWVGLQQPPGPWHTVCGPERWQKVGLAGGSAKERQGPEDQLAGAPYCDSVDVWGKDKKVKPPSLLLWGLGLFDFLRVQSRSI